MTDPNALCPICRATPQTYPLGDKEGYRYLACRACGSARIDPFPTQSLIDTFVAEIEPQLIPVADPEQRITVIQRIITKTLPPAAPGKNRLLDVNAQQGYTTVAARNAGYQVTGLNSWGFAHEFASKHYGDKDFLQSRLQEYAAAHPTQADVILCPRIFGQQTDCDGFTASLKQALAPGGVIYIEEDDGNHLNTPRDLNDWVIVEPPLTCHIIAKKGMKKMLARHGLAIRKAYFTWAPYMRLLVEHAK